MDWWQEEEYITLDLGPEMDPKYLQTEGTYQLIVRPLFSAGP